RVIEKNDVEIGLGVEQRLESLAHLPGHFLAVSLVIRQQAEHHAAGFIVVPNAREVGPGHGGAETEQDRQRLLQAPLRRAVLFAEADDVGSGILMKHSNLRSFDRRWWARRETQACPPVFRRSNGFRTRRFPCATEL